MPFRPALLLVPGILAAVFFAMAFMGGAAEPLSFSKSYAHCPSLISAGQKRVYAALNLPDSLRILPPRGNRYSGGKFVVSRTGEAYNSDAIGSKSEIPAYISQVPSCYQM